MRLAVALFLIASFLILGYMAMQSPANAQPPSATVIFNDIQNTDGSSKVPLTVTTLPATPCNDEAVVIRDNPGASADELFVCDDQGGGLQWHLISGGGGGGASSLQAAKDGGRTITNATSAGTSVEIGSATSFMRIYNDPALGPVVECIAGGSSCLEAGAKLAATGIFCIRNSAGVQLFCVDEATGQVTYNHNRILIFHADTFRADGSVCTDSQEVEVTTTGGDTVKEGLANCGTISTSGKFDMRAGLDNSVAAGSTIDVKLVGVSSESSPAGSHNFNVKTRCVASHGGLFTEAFGTPQALEITYAGRTQWQSTVSASDAWTTVAPGGSCGAGTIPHVRLEMLGGAGDNDTVLSGAFLVQVMIRYTSGTL